MSRGGKIERPSANNEGHFNRLVYTGLTTDDGISACTFAFASTNWPGRRSML